MRPICAFLAACLAILLLSPANAADILRVGKAAQTAFAFVPLDVGIASGIFRKHGLEIEPVSLSGSAKIHQAMAAGALDIALASGPDFPFLINGAPEIGVAALAGPPLYLGIVALYDSPLRVPDDLKGKRIGVSSIQSLTAWLVREFARTSGWQPGDVTLIGVGAEWAGQLAALKTSQIDAVVESTAMGHQMENAKVARTVVRSADYVTDFLMHVAFANATLAKDHPDQVGRFLDAWFETIAFMRGHRDESVRIARTVTGFDQEVEENEYDTVMPMFSADGKFDPKALAVLDRSFVEMKMTEKPVDLTKYYTERYLPRP